MGRAGGRGAGPPQPGAGLPQRQRDAGCGREHGIGRRHRRLAGGHRPGRGLPDLLAGRDRLGPLRHRGRQRAAADQGGPGPREEGQLLGGGHRQRRDADGHHRGDHQRQRPERGAQLRRRRQRVGERGGEPDGGGHAGGDRPGEGRPDLPAGHGGGLQRSRGLQRPRVLHHDRRRGPDLQGGPGLRGRQEHLHPGDRGAGQQGRRRQGRHGLGRRRHPDGQRHRRGRAARRARRSGGEFHGQRADRHLDGAGDDGEAAADGLRRGAAAAHQRRRRPRCGLERLDGPVPHRHGGQREPHGADAGGDLPGAGAGGQRRGERPVGRAGGRRAGAPQPGAGLPQRQRDAGRGREHGAGHGHRRRRQRADRHGPGRGLPDLLAGRDRLGPLRHRGRQRPAADQGGAELREEGQLLGGRRRQRRDADGHHRGDHQRERPERGAELRRRGDRVGERGGEPDGGGHAGGDRPGWGRPDLPAGHGGGGIRSGDQRPRFLHHDRRRGPDLQGGAGLRGGQEQLHPGDRGAGQQGRRRQGRHGLGRRRHPDGQRHRRGRAARRARRSGGEFHGQRADGDLDGAGDDGQAAADRLRRGTPPPHQRRRRRQRGLERLDGPVPRHHHGQRQHHRADAGGHLPGAGAGGQRRGERGVGRAGGRGAGAPQPGAGLPQRQRDAGRGREHGAGHGHRRRRQRADRHGPGRGLPDLLAGRDRLGPLRHRGRQRPAADQGGAGPREEGQLLGGRRRQRRDADGHHRGDHQRERPERGARASTTGRPRR